VFVSDSRKVVFIHIQKTGGLTVDRLLNERIPDLHRIGARHGFASLGMDELNDWDEYFKFAFVRNPWDRLVSWYSMVTTMPREGNELWRYVHDNSSTFEEFIYNCTDEVEIKDGVHYSFAYNQLDYVTDERGNLLVDFIGRLENFDKDLQEVFRRMGFELESVPHKNRSGHQHYSTFYTPDTELIVRERFKRDIEYFGYEFESLREPRALFVSGCDRIGTTALTDYLNRHPKILVCQESSETTQQGEITLDPSAFERMLDPLPMELGDAAPHNDGDRLIEPRAELLANRDPSGLQWVGASNSDFLMRMESVAGNNPGARFIVMYRRIEEIAESWEPEDAPNHQNSNDGFERAVKTWNRGLQSTRRFIRDSLIPSVLLIDYHDFLYRTELVVLQISRFLELEFDETVAAVPSDKVPQPERVGSEEKQSSIRKHANRAAEAWILDRIERQWQKPALYTQRTSKSALATSLEEAEAKTWRLQEKVRELERDRERRRQRFEQLQSSSSWRLLNTISSIRIRIAGR
jgi:chondroitin 4-sulfotransferase 11